MLCCKKNRLQVVLCYYVEFNSCIHVINVARKKTDSVNHKPSQAFILCSRFYLRLSLLPPWSARPKLF